MKKLMLVAVLMFVATVSNAGTAFLVGESQTGMTKQCKYDYLGSRYVKTFPNYAICPLTQYVQDAPSYEAPRVQPPEPRTVTGFLVRESVTGMTKQCVYNVLGSTYVETLQAVQLCPLTVQVRQ